MTLKEQLKAASYKLIEFKKLDLVEKEKEELEKQEKDIKEALIITKNIINEIPELIEKALKNRDNKVIIFEYIKNFKNSLICNYLIDFLKKEDINYVFLSKPKNNLEVFWQECILFISI